MDVSFPTWWEFFLIIVAKFSRHLRCRDETFLKYNLFWQEKIAGRLLSFFIDCARASKHDRSKLIRSKQKYQKWTFRASQIAGEREAPVAPLPPRPLHSAWWWFQRHGTVARRNLAEEIKDRRSIGWIASKKRTWIADWIVMQACHMPSSRPGDRFAAPLLEAENPWGGGGRKTERRE